MQVVGRARSGRVLAAGAGEEVGAVPWEKVVKLMAVNRLIALRSELSIRELGRWRTGWMVNFNSAGCCDDHYAKYTTSISTGTWYHIAGVYDSGAQTLTLYVNGASVATSDVTGYRPITGGGLSLYWGRETYAGHDLAATLDDSRVYSRALSAPPTLVTSPAKC
jgi:hypothetical protein